MALTGRLGMTTEQAIECFARLSDEVFSNEKIFGTPAFRASKMEKALKDIMQRRTKNKDEPMMEGGPSTNKCKLMVFAMPKHNMNAGIPIIFRSYQSNSNTGPNCTIWQALRAATAHPEMFKPMDITEHNVSQPYVDAAMGCGNPIEYVLAEAKNLYPNRRIACIVSIGGGHPRTICIPQRSVFTRVFPTNVVVAMRDVATDNERMAQTMARRFQGVPNVYFRLNVDQGMQSMRLGSWDRLGEIAAHTRSYMQKTETAKNMKKVAKAIGERKGVILMDRIDGVVRAEEDAQQATIRECPTTTSVYTGRHIPEQRAISCLTSDTRDRRIFVFHGLGGAGKTQLALRTVELTRERWSDVIYIDATSVETLTSTLSSFAIARGIGKTHQDTIRWLTGYSKRWLLVLDNADDPSIDLRSYLPAGVYCRIIITTRSRDLTFLKQGPSSEYNVSSMEPEEALDLLFTMTRSDFESLTNQERETATALTQDLGLLALAIVQAGAYICRTSCGFANYREMYAMRPKEILEKYSCKPMELGSYEKTVYRTWVMSYSMLTKRAQRMLWLLAYLQRDRISEVIFCRAVTGSKHFQPSFPPTETEYEALVNLKEYLSSFLLDGKWNLDDFLAVMTEISSYSLVLYDRTNKAYTLHILVQDWVRSVITHPVERALAESSYLLAMSITRDGNAQDYAYCLSLQPHVDRLLSYKRYPSPSIAIIFGYIMHQSGRYEQAEAILSYTLKLYSEVLGDDAEETLLLKSDLAETYSRQGSLENTETLETQVLEARTRLLGEKHPKTLLARVELAGTYNNKRLHIRAEELLVPALADCKRLLGSNHCHTLKVMRYLAGAYFGQSLYTQAGTLQAQALEAMRLVLGDEHPETLSAMSNLALTYSYQGLRKRTGALQIQVLEVTKRVLGDEHPDTLTAMNNLALTYSHQGLHKQAETLQVQVMEAMKRVLGDEHPNTLSATNNLASTYSDQGLHKQAEALQVQVVEARKRLLGDEHPNTLSAMSNLALTYSHQGLHKQAETLRMQVLEAMKRVLGDEHPNTLSAMNNLASTYSNQGLHEQAEALLVQVVEARKRVLGYEHPDTLTAMNNLALTYSDQGLHKQAETLLVQMVEARKRVLGDEHPDTLTTINNLACMHFRQGRYEQSQTLFNLAVQARKKVLGLHHTKTISSMKWLAETYLRLGTGRKQEYMTMIQEIREVERSKGT
ncbi:kinesin light chain [Ceratobasidium sp. AG-Ba]|nr:kinesin light chain [Ceratobasidium sp. AG-Ba]